MSHDKISARRYGRLLAVTTLRKSGKLEYNMDTIIGCYDALSDYIPVNQEEPLPESVKNQILNFAQTLLKGISDNIDAIIDTVNKVSKNRTWTDFTILDQSLLLTGIFNLSLNTCDPKIIIKETLIISDILKNEHAAPYLSGILKTIAYGELKTKRLEIKKNKIRLKAPTLTRND
ncbi:MAG: transcription antitermination factor NusB [Brevinemataceae bacterium]